MDFRKNGSYRRVDVGIAPYANSEDSRSFVGADDSVRPQKILFFTEVFGELDGSRGRAESPAPTKSQGNFVNV